MRHRHLAPSVISAVTVVLLVLLVTSTSVRAEDRTLSGALVTGTYDVYGEVQTDGYTVIENGVQVRLRSLEQTTFSPGFRVMAGGGLHVSSLSSSVPDEWKLRYFGTLEVDMEADPDGDGYTNLAELFMGTDPTVADNSLADTDGDGLADSWEMLHYGTLDYAGGDDPGGDGYTLADDYQDVLDYFYSNAILYLSGEVAAGHYRAIEIHSRGWTRITVDNAVHLTKRDSVRLFADFSVARGATFTVSAAGTPSITAPDPPTNLRAFFPSSVAETFQDNAPHMPASSTAYETTGFETGTLRLDHNWQRVDLSRPFTNPVVVAGPPSYNGGNPSTVRVRNLDETGFDIRIQEWEYLDGAHILESVPYLVIEEGAYTLKDGTPFEAGFFTGAADPRQVQFQHSYEAAPVVLTQVSTIEDSAAVTGRIKNVSHSGFEFFLQEQETTRTSHGEERVGYIAWQVGTGELFDGVGYEGGLTTDSVTHNWHTIAFSQTFATTPLLVARMQRADGGDTAVLRSRSLARVSGQVKIEEEQSRDSEMNHTTESVGYLALSAVSADRGFLITKAPADPPHHAPLSGAATGDSLGLRWDENAEFDIAGYRLYRDGSLLTTLLIDAVSFIDETVQHGTTYTYQVSAVDLAGKESGLSAPLTLTADFVAPNLISGFPGQGELITSNGEPVSMLITFGDSGGGIASIRIYDENGNDITNRVLRVNNSIELMLFNPHSGEYRYRIVVTDHGGNTLTYELVFTVDATPLETIASPAGGDFGEPVSVTLTASKTATIYYSVDGYPPIVGSATFGPSPIEDIALSENTSLQFFAVDETGYQERTNNEIYRFTNLLIGVEGVSATAQSDPPRVELTWQPVTGLDNPAYQVFRCLGEIDCAILAAARQGRYPPPQRFALNASPRSSTTFTDSEVMQGATYRYAVLVADGQGTPGLLSELVSAQIAVTTEPADESEAINRAVAWLKQTQSPQGTWGASGPLTMLATSQALSGLQRAQSADAGMTDALFYLRGHLGNNTDYQARKILTLNRFGHNTDEAVNRLISYAVIDQDAISGWGLTHRYAPDALDTALGLMAVGLSENPPTATNSVELLSGESLTAAAGSGAYGWRSGGDTSIFVSGAVYNALQGQTGTPTFDRQWLFDLQRDDGSFNDSLTDTAAVLLWLEPPAAVRDSAAHYLISAQEENGSWGNDAYLTGLCLEALLVGDMP
jgi:hypothetical protein